MSKFTSCNDCAHIHNHEFCRGCMYGKVDNFELSRKPIEIYVACFDSGGKVVVTDGDLAISCGTVYKFAQVMDE